MLAVGEPSPRALDARYYTDDLIWQRERRDVFARLDSALHDAPPRRSADHVLEITLGELRNVEVVSHS